MRIVVLVSGEGRNLQALIDHCHTGQIAGQIVAVISNKLGVGGLLRAEQAGIPALTLDHTQYPSRSAFDTALMQAIDAYTPDLLVLAGFMRILTPAFTQHYLGRCLNIHPSLLPRHPGLHTHAAALAAGDAEHGATVHFVTAALDGGPAVLQGRLNVHGQDCERTLAERVMQQVELHIYPQAVAWFASGALQLQGATPWLHGRPLAQPLCLALPDGSAS